MRYGVSLLNPDYFEADDEKEVLQAILDFHAAYKRVPSDPEDVVAIAGEKHVDLVYDIYDERDYYDLEFARDVALQWAKEQAAKIAVLDSIDDINKGSLANVVERLKEALKVGDNLTIPGIDVVKDALMWATAATEIEKIPTGLLHVDIAMDGGLSPGELGIFLAPSNRGKTMAMVNIAYGAAGIGSGKNVVIFSHELSADKYAKRFGARTLFTFPSRSEDGSKYAEDFQRAARMLIPGNVRVISGVNTPEGIRTALGRLASDGMKPDLIIDDYSDLMEPPRRYNQRRFEYTAIVQWLRELGEEWECPVWTASQTTRSAYDKEIISETDIAEDIGKVNTADVIIALCQTRDEAKNDRCRLYGAKVRDGERGFMVDAKYYGKSQAIVTTGFTKMKEEEDA